MAKTVLVVDDSATTREMIIFALNNAGYGVITAVHGKDALNKLNMTTVDMVITDIEMPVMDGTELLKQLRSGPEYRRIPVIVMLPSYQELERQEFMLTDVDGWIVKPFAADELLEVIKLFMK